MACVLLGLRASAHSLMHLHPPVSGVATCFPQRGSSDHRVVYYERHRRAVRTSGQEGMDRGEGGRESSIYLHVIIHSFNKYLLSSYSVNVLGIGLEVRTKESGN